MNVAGQTREPAKPRLQTQQLAKPNPASLPAAAPVVQRHIAGYLTYAETIRFMLASRRLRVAISEAPRNRLLEFSDSFRRLWREQAPPTAPHDSNPSGFWKKKTLRLKGAVRALRKETQPADGNVESNRQELAAGVENVVFHFAANAPGQPGKPDSDHAHLHNAIHDGNSALVRAGLREFLSLWSPMLSPDQKVAWLREARGLCSLQDFGQYPCGRLQPEIRLMCDAIAAAVDEIASSQYLRESEITELCVKPQVYRLDNSGRQALIGIDLVGNAYDNKNPAVAASILLGIHESAANAKLKSSMLRACAESWSGSINRCVRDVSESLVLHGAPSGEVNDFPERASWIANVITRLQAIKVSSAE